MTNRSAFRRRTTKETAIEVRLVLDGTGHADVTTGLPFFDHMIGQLGKHGGFDLSVSADGDLHVDAHHTVEDVGIALGECLREALGDKSGVRRFASTRGPARRSAYRGGDSICRDDRSSSTKSIPVPAGRLTLSAVRRSTRNWPRSSGGPSPRRPP